MVGSIVKHSLYAHYRIPCQGALHHGFLDTLFHCREVVLRNRAAHYDLLEHVGRLQIAGGLEGHLYMAVLSVSAGLLLVLGIHVRFLADGLPEGYLRTLQLDLYFEFIRQLADHHIQVLIAHAVEQGLAVLGIIHILQRQILFHHS